MFVKLNSTVRDSFGVSAGVPHRSVIALILFPMYVDRFYQLENQISQFAENFDLYYRSLSSKLIGKY